MSEHLQGAGIPTTPKQNLDEDYDSGEPGPSNHKRAVSQTPQLHSLVQLFVTNDENKEQLVTIYPVGPLDYRDLQFMHPQNMFPWHTQQKTTWYDAILIKRRAQQFVNSENDEDFDYASTNSFIEAIQDTCDNDEDLACEDTNSVNEIFHRHQEKVDLIDKWANDVVDNLLKYPRSSLGALEGGWTQGEVAGAELARRQYLAGNNQIRRDDLVGIRLWKGKDGQTWSGMMKSCATNLEIWGEEAEPHLPSPFHKKVDQGAWDDRYLALSRETRDLKIKW